MTESFYLKTVRKTEKAMGWVWEHSSLKGTFGYTITLFSGPEASEDHQGYFGESLEDAENRMLGELAKLA